MSENPSTKSYIELRPFRFWCQKVLPLVYDDSLSYYELLCKVIDFLNKTMEDVEVIHGDVETLGESYVELQEFVDHYFENVDVQEEINNKLDEMASDGSLSTLLSPLIPDIVTKWLETNISPTAPIIDYTLSINKAGADSRVTGGLRKVMDQSYQSIRLEPEIEIIPVFTLGYSISADGSILIPYPLNGRASTLNFYETFGEFTIETDGTPYAIAFYDNNIEGTPASGTNWFTTNRTFTNAKKYIRIVIKNDNGFDNYENHITMKTINPLYNNAVNISKYVQNNEKLLSINKITNQPYNIKFNRVSNTEIESNKLYVKGKYYITNKLPSIDDHYININISEYSYDDTLINTSNNWSFVEYIGTSENVAYIIITVHYGTNLSLSDELMLEIEQNIQIYDSPLRFYPQNNSFLAIGFKEGIVDFAHNGYILRPVTDGVRLVSDFFYIDENLYLLGNKNTDFQYYVKYYDSDFNYLADGTYHASNSVCEVEGSAYCRLVVTILNPNLSVDDAIEELESIAYIYNPILTYTTVNSSGQIVGTPKIRMSTKQLYIKNGCLHLNATAGFDYFISYYDKDKNFLYTSNWYSRVASANNYLIFNVPVKDNYVVITVALTNNRGTDIVDNNILNGGRIFTIEEFDVVDEISPYSYYYPDYYETEMINAINVIKGLDKDTICFAMYTDPHDNNPNINSYNLNQIETLRKIANTVNLDFVVFGGDISDGLYKTKADCISKFEKLVNGFKTLGKPVLCLRGNHDDNSYQGNDNEDYIISRKEFYNTLVAPLCGTTEGNSYTYFYKDFRNYRVICLDYLDYPEVINNGSYTYTGYKANWRGYSNEQVAWLCETLLNCDKYIIVASHYSTNVHLMNELSVVSNVNYQNITDALIAFNNRETFTFNNVTYDFSNCTGKVLIEISGHSHAYGAFKENGIVWSTTGSTSPEVTRRVFDSNDYETMTTRNYLDSSEAHFNIFCLNSRGVKIIAFGAMNDINLTY